MPGTNLGNFQDANVPFPRSSGARFCGAGQLVCFGWAYTVKVTSANPTVKSSAIKTPRALSAVSSAQMGQMGGNTPPHPHHLMFASNAAGSVSAMKRTPRASNVRFSRTSKGRISSAGSSLSEEAASKKRTISESERQAQTQPQNQHDGRGMVTIYDALPLLPFSKHLAQK